MAVGVLMPKQGITVESCIITEWYKKKGDQVKVGEPLFGYETDKATFDCESTAEGEILEIFFQNGDDVPVLVNVCAVGQPGEDISALRPASAEDAAPAAEAAPAPAAQAAPATESAPAAAAVPTEPATGEIKASPRARNLAADQHLDLRFAKPSGPYGRIIERDVRAAIDQGLASTSAAFDAASAAGLTGGTGIGGRVGVADLTAAPAASAAPAQAAASEGPAYTDVKFSGIRRAICKSMTTSLTTIPQLTHNTSFDASEIMGFRAKLKKNAETLGLGNITLNDMVLFVVSRVLMNYPDLNANMLDETTIRRFSDVHLGVAVDTERGLMVPVIHYANRKSLSEISAEAKELAKQAQSGSINPDLLAGGTFTVTNLGSLGIESFTPVINPPQTGILGVDNIVTRVRESGGNISTYPAMGLSLTYDHRAIDGAPASRFLRELCQALENFAIFLSK